MSNIVTLPRITGLIIIEVRNSNPNGNPDNEGEPRLRTPSNKGEITGVSFKRKLRDLVELKEGPVWQIVSQSLEIQNRATDFEILESRGRNRQEINGMNRESFQKKYWDARLFGTTFLESMKDDKVKRSSEEVEHFIRTGVVQLSNAISIAPVKIERLTNTNKSGVQEGKDRGMAPLGYRVVEHGVYCLPLFINPTAMCKSGCQKEDIDLLKSLIPHAYRHTASHIRNAVEIRKAWWIEHKSPLGSCSDFDLIDALSPKKKENINDASQEWSEYDVPQALPENLAQRVASCIDLAG
jgi:CRISPR-associated protein Csd2